MLTVEEQQNSIRYSVELDHCYTSRLSPSDPKPRDPLPTIDSPTPSDNVQYEHQLSPSQGTSSALSSVVDGDGTPSAKAKSIIKAVSTRCNFNVNDVILVMQCSMSGMMLFLE